MWLFHPWHTPSLSYTLNLGASPQLEYWNYGLPWRDGICTCNCYHCLWMPDFPLPHLDMPGLGQGIMGYGKMEQWVNLSWTRWTIGKIPLDREANEWVASLLKPTFHPRHSRDLRHSIIPFGLQETCSIRNAVISISCRNSDTFYLFLR